MNIKHFSIIGIFSFLSLAVFASDNTIPTFPAQVMDLTNWKITLPIDLDANGNADEIIQPALNTYSDANFFHVNNTGDGIVFRANADGVTTSGSGYPRSELREMINSGQTLANWASNDGLYHIMTLDEKITHYPDVKKHVVVGQIHDASDDIVMVRLETNKLFLEFNGADGPTLTSNYVLGTRFNLKIEVYNNQIKFYFNGTLVYTKDQTFSGAYFKAGMYTQSSCQGSKQVAGELCTAYGEMELFGVSIYHGATLPTSNKLITNDGFKVNVLGENILIENAGITGKTALSIYNTLGKKYFSKIVTLSGSKVIIPLNVTLPTDTYIVSLSQESKKFTTKFVVK